MIANNTINRVLVQNVEGLWVYDDSKYGVEKQPLVFGADLIIEKMVSLVKGKTVKYSKFFPQSRFRGRSFALILFGRKQRGSFITGKKRSYRAGSALPSAIIFQNLHQKYFCNCSL